jgi:tRNA dimethylallyltransferase
VPTPDPRAPAAALLFGATATGKTALAVELAARVPIEVISADSRQVYRHLRVGTAQPTPAERAAVPHHLVAFLELHETYNAARFRADALQLLAAIRARGRLPVVVGGAGFYLQVLREGLFEAPYDQAALLRVRRELHGWSTAALRDELQRRDPERAAAIHAHDRYRLARAVEICLAAGRSVTALTAARRQPPERFVECRLQVDRDALHRHIAERTAALFRAGWIDEVRQLLAAGADPASPGMATLGYPHVVAYLRGDLGREALEERVNRDTRRFARHQETWFRKAGDAVVLPAGAAGNAGRLASLLEPLVPPGGGAA